MTKKIIDPVPVELLKAELTKSKKLEDTNKGHNELYRATPWILMSTTRWRIHTSN